MIKACEAKGKLILFNEPTPCEEAWFIAKNNGHEKYAAIWNCKQAYGCKYPAEVEAKVKDLAQNVHVKQVGI